MAMDPGTFEKATGQTKPELDDEIICYCMKGIRSKTAAEQLDDLGYTNVYNYEGGWWEWTGWPQNIKSPEWQNWAKETQFDFSPYLKPKTPK